MTEGEIKKWNDNGGYYKSKMLEIKKGKNVRFGDIANGPGLSHIRLGLML